MSTQTLEQPLQLPGISPDIIRNAQVRQVDADTALACCGIHASGLLIPYYDIHGAPVMDEGGPFSRLRLDTPRGDQKYHQRNGTKPHAYLPPGTNTAALNAKITIIIEGEKKTLALADENHILPIGIGGFYSFRDESGVLVPELTSGLQAAPNAHVAFFGDRDVIFNFQFAQAASELAGLIFPRLLLVSCLPFDSPGKGIDDCKATVATFSSFLIQTLVKGIWQNGKSSPAKLAIDLLKAKLPAKVAESDRDQIIRGCAKLAASFSSYPLELETLTKFSVEFTKVGRAVFKRLVKEARADRASDLLDDGSIDLNQPTGVWTRQVLEIFGPKSFFFAKNLCHLQEGKLVAYTAPSLAPSVDHPDCCKFVRSGKNGEICPVSLKEADARLVLGHAAHTPELLRPVAVLSPMPVLAWTPAGSKLITGYDRETKILAASEPFGMPNTEQACEYLKGLLRDFRFASPGDHGRAFAMLLTLALVKGGFLDSGRAPFFMIEKDSIGTGAGTLVKLTAAINGINPLSITPDDPRSAKEDISKHLLGGAGFLSFDNIRGNVLSKLPFFESLLTEPEFTCRAPYLQGVVDVTRCVFVCTSNGAVLSQDLASRTVKIKILKQPEDYPWCNWIGGDLIDHAKIYSRSYLAYVFALINDWARLSRPPGVNVTGFRFTHWEKACSWILERNFPELPLLDQAHRNSQQELSNPHFDLIRNVLREAVSDNGGKSLSPTDFTRIAVQLGLMNEDDEQHKMKAGRILAEQFPKNHSYDFAGEFQVVRSTTADAHGKDLKRYFVKPMCVR